MKNIFGKVLKAVDEFSGSKATLFAINKMISAYGVMEELSINRENKTICFTLLLHGDEKATSFVIDKYNFVSNDSDFYIELINLSCDRAGLNQLIQDFLLPHRIELPRDKQALITGFLS